MYPDYKYEAWLYCVMQRLTGLGINGPRVLNACQISPLFQIKRATDNPLCSRKCLPRVRRARQKET